MHACLHCMMLIQEHLQKKNINVYKTGVASPWTSYIYSSWCNQIFWIETMRYQVTQYTPSKL